MPPIGQPPKTIYESELLKSLESKSDKEDGAYSLACDFIKVTSPLLDSIIAGPFEHYTLHNRDHAKKLLHLADALLPTKTIERLSIVEHLLLIYAAHLHDLGLVLSPADRDSVIRAEEFQASVRSWPELYASLQDARQRAYCATTDEDKSSSEAEIFQLTEAAITNYMRPLHATPERYRNLISMLKSSSGRNDLFSYRNASFEDWLIDICVSHNLSANVLAASNGPFDDKYPRDALVAGQRLNTQFCAIVLRLTDILDFDRERTPRILFESLGISYRNVPGADVTLREWQKHLAVHTISIDPDEIVVAADCHHPVIEKTVRDFCQLIEREIRDSLALLRRNAQDTVNQYYFDLPLSVRPKIRSIGYVFRDMSLQLNQAAIATLLMGEKLYSSGAVAIRELLQNAIDACNAREATEKQAFPVSITVRDFADNDGRVWIEVSDTGIGMDEHVLSEYFLKLGNSYYDSPEFKRLIGAPEMGTESSFTPIARFGIGIASVFMLADLFEVETRTLHSLFNDTKSRVVRVERMGSLAFVTESTEGAWGTRVRIRMKRDPDQRYSSLIGSISSYLKQTVLRPKYDIGVSLGAEHYVLKHDRKLELKADSAELLKELEIEILQIELDQYSALLSGSVVLFFQVQSDGRLSYKDKHDQPLRFTRDFDPGKLFTNYNGNRVAVNGFRMNQKKMATILGLGKERIRLILDINVSAGREIEYDVARDKVVGWGRIRIAAEFREALLKAATAAPIFDRLDSETRILVNKILGVSTRAFIENRSWEADTQELRKAVEGLIPDGIWHKGLHRDIAGELGVRIAAVAIVMHNLVEEGLLNKPIGDGRKRHRKGARLIEPPAT